MTTTAKIIDFINHKIMKFSPHEFGAKNMVFLMKHKL